MEPVVDNSTAYGLREAKSHPEDHPPRAPELGEGAAGMVLTIAPKFAFVTKVKRSAFSRPINTVC